MQIEPLRRPIERRSSESGSAFQRKLADIYPRLLRQARRIAGNRADAEDLVHDAVERGLLRRHLFRDGQLERWIATVLRHLFFDRCRRRRSWRGICVELVYLQHTKSHGDGALGVDALDRSSAQAASLSYDGEDVRRAVTDLAPRLREVFSLFVFERLPQREIGRRLSLPISTVGTRLLRARRRLRMLMEAADLSATVDHPAQRPAGGSAAPPRPASPRIVNPAVVRRRANPWDCSWSSAGRTKKIALPSCSPP